MRPDDASRLPKHHSAMHHVALLIGGNQGDRRRLIGQATEQIRHRIGSVVASSSILETAPWGEFDERAEVQNFLNQALLVETSMSAHEVLREALAIEAGLGRVRQGSPHEGDSPADADGAHASARTGQGYGQPAASPLPLQPRLYHSRPIDIDLIFFDHAVIDTPDLVIPHPCMHRRSFVLVPLSEIMPEYVHPVLGKSVRDMLNALSGEALDIPANTHPSPRTHCGDGK